MTCDDETCDYTTLSLNLRVIGDSERGTACPNYPRCNGRLVRQYSELNVHKQLSYFCYLLDDNRFIDKLTSFTHFCEFRESQLLHGCPMACPPSAFARTLADSRTGLLEPGNLALLYSVWEELLQSKGAYKTELVPTWKRAKIKASIFAHNLHK
ncbi:DNA polymerase alpha catalytic subunit [Tanacetum coccineum]